VVSGVKQKELSVGTYLDVSLKAATILRDDIRAQVRSGTDPAKERKSDKLHDALGEIAIEWHDKQSPNGAKSYSERTFGRINANLIRWIGDESISDITHQVLR